MSKSKYEMAIDFLEEYLNEQNNIDMMEMLDNIMAYVEHLEKQLNEKDFDKPVIAADTRLCGWN